MNDPVARAALLMAWAPLCGWLVLTLDKLVGAIPLESPRVVTGVLTVLTAAWLPFLWRAYVHWARWRGLTTAAAAALLLIHAIAWQPILPVSGCLSRDLLVASQSLTLTGLWWIGCIVAWWGGACLAQSPALVNFAHGRRLMSADVARLLICLALFPLAYGTAGVMHFAEEYWGGDTTVWTDVRTLLVIFTVALIVPIALWRKRVIWTRARLLGTTGLAALLLASAFGPLIRESELANTQPLGDWLELLGDSAHLLGVAVWIAGAAWLWRYRAGERPPGLESSAIDISRLARCPTCQYGLTGLREVRCPECGWSGTVDGLLEQKLADALDVRP
ncbi:MAG: hypothetical protein LC135_15680 [Phycisphaerae bacterium]|nr:hypothetical protein [Phycisphaerae bacterium]MCZ2401282.1 hypothetical protein [Phycisphaerae bacterium]NUQ50427.1 hypothetical protein [Phycisphaerae bacterium]